jgi:hypothetical protein
MDAKKLVDWLNEVHAATEDYGWEMEHMDALIRIGEHAIKLGLAGDGVEVAEQIEVTSDYMEQWGAHCDPAEAMVAVLRKYLV